MQFVDVFPRTADRQGAICSPRISISEAPAGLYAYQPDPATDRFPLALISPASRPHDQLHARRAAATRSAVADAIQTDASARQIGRR